MSKLREAVEQYLQLRDELGYKPGGAVRLLRSFVTFAEREEAAHVTTDLVLRWAEQPQGIQPVTLALRLNVVRRFAVWLSASDQHTQVRPLATCCPANIAASGHTSTATQKSKNSSTQQAGSDPLPD